MSRCLVCEAEIEPFISFGKMPIANGFLEERQLAEETFYELKVAHCRTCQMVQLTNPIAREKMFHENYAFFSSTSNRMAGHFAALAETVIKNYLSTPDPFVVEIGSNDGICLRHFAKRGIRHLGVEPSANVADAARKNGVETLCRFFGDALAEEIVVERGQADVIFAANLMCHIPHIHPVVDGVQRLLKPGGVFIFEDPYLGNILQGTAYDQMYDEHAFYFSVTSVKNLFERHGMQIIDVAPQNVHGGSMRYIVGHRGKRVVSSNLGQQLELEKKLGFDQPSTLDAFRRRVESSRAALVLLLTRLRHEHKRVVGYGATSKSTTVTNFCDIDSSLVEFICDTTPIKQGKLSPGKHIPVRPHLEFSQSYPDYALLFAWNHAEEIMFKEADFQRHGGKWIVYVPKVKISS